MEHTNRRPGSKTGSAAPVLGIVEYFRPGEVDRVEEAIIDLKRLGVRELRTALSWAEWHATGGEEWFDWLIPRLAREVGLLPTVLYTPPSIAVEPKSSAPPKRPRDYADFIDTLITRYGDHFEWIELWNEPNNLNDWDYRLDPDWMIFSEMIGAAAYWARRRGKKTVLAGACPNDHNWIRLMCERGVVRHIDAVGLHGFPGTWDFAWEGWERIVAGTQAVLDEFGLSPEVWISETGFSTWRHDYLGQMRCLLEAVDAPVRRVYWYSLHDLHPDQASQEGFHEDERHYHLGLKKSCGTEKLLYRLLAQGGPENVRRTLSICGNGNGRSKARPPRPRTLITGGAGFIGSNLADHILSSGNPVVVLDNLSRPGVERNLRWLKRRHGSLLTAEIADVRDRYALRRAMAKVDHVFHLAAQVAVTTSLDNPVHDFEVNVGGTVNLLEEMRGLRYPPTLVFASTNKVYGNLQDVPLTINCTRYYPLDPEVRAHGVSEDRPLDFHSPYGCSKGAADQYVIDYARSFDLPAVVFRMSCIYGPRQFGTEDQGWVAHFLIRALSGSPLTLFGDGKQVRDLLFVGDLVDAYLLAQDKIDRVKGSAFNLGGGPANTSSLLELIASIDRRHGIEIDYAFEDWRKGDQPYYVSDTRKLSAILDWSPAVDFPEGLNRLSAWIEAYRSDPNA